MKSTKNISQILNHLGESREQYFNAVAPPIIQSSNFAFPTVKDFRAGLKDEMTTAIYTRGANPTVNILREKLAALEHTEDALVFSSGSAAIAAAIVSNVEQGDHIICIKNPYHWTEDLLNGFLKQFGVTTTFVAGHDISNIEGAIQPNTKVLFLESPNSITFELQDLQTCAKLARALGIITIIDNSHATPIYQKPADLGIDIIVHSATKYIGGHSDTMGGVLCSTSELVKKAFDNIFMTFGACISPQDAWLLIRGLRTLPLRVQRSNDSAQKIITKLKGHPQIERIYYPFDLDFPQYELAQQQMTGAGGLFSILLKTQDIKQVELFVNSLQYFLLAASWGGYESLVFPTCILYPEEGAPYTNLPFNLVRFYVGLEEPEFLLQDILQGLAIISS